jgi:2-oxoglutarate ferredoxin oxidoreductase subunit beta
LKVATIGEDGVSEDDILIHDAHEENNSLHLMLIKMKGPEFPTAMGIIRAVATSTYNDQVAEQIEEAKKTAKINTMDDLLSSGNTWHVKE